PAAVAKSSDAARPATPVASAEPVAAAASDTRAAEPAPAPVGLGAMAATAPATTLPGVGQIAQLAAAPAAPKYKDGSYTGWGTSRHGDIEATVVISAGRIQSARISQCWTRYS